VTIEEALKTAIEYETRVWTVYVNALKQATNKIGRRVFGVLASEEQGHLKYLRSRLDEWEKTGNITVENLKTAIPSREAIEKEFKKLSTRMGDSPQHSEITMLTKARDLEMETSNFYKKMVSELSGDGQKLFARFVEIEEGHLALVQAELDAVSGNGFWFDMPEFNLEAG
jgi:rubrerythrin